MSAISDVFNELLFGAGSWIGLTILLLLCIGGSLSLKYSGSIFGLILLFLGIQYLNNVPVDSNFIWSVILCWISAIFVFLNLAREIKS